MRAIDIGVAARNRHLFNATANYDKIVIDIVDARLGSDTLGNTLYIIGAGMLGRSILFSGLPRRFVGTRLLTRDPKALRKKLRGVVIPSLKCACPSEVDVSPEPRSVFVIATGDVAEPYQRVLEELIRRVEPSATIELSSIPAFSQAFADTAHYTNMYSEYFLSFVRTNNELMEAKAEAVKEDIAVSVDVETPAMRTGTG